MKCSNLGVFLLVSLTWFGVIQMRAEAGDNRSLTKPIPVIKSTKSPTPLSNSSSSKSKDLLNKFKQNYRFFLMIFAAILIVGGAVMILVKLLTENEKELGKKSDNDKINHSYYPVNQMKETVNYRNNHNYYVDDIELVNHRVKVESNLSEFPSIEQLIIDLQNPQSAIRNRAIWELGQRGDSRAIQPLVNLFLEADSVQQSLILGSLAEITTRTLKPITRTLNIALQDPKAEVRKNAIRDLTKIYELVIEISQLLDRTIDDPDTEVRETTRWALSQLSRLRPPSSR